MKAFTSRRRSSAGFSLIEVLIALLVLAFGLLGLALLQTLNLRYTQSANQRTQAIGLANDMLDMMRSNRSEMASYAMPNGDMSGVVIPPGGCTMNNVLSASVNVARWKCEVRQTLGANARAEVTTTAANEVSVTVGWSESGNQTNQVELGTRL